MRFGKPTEQSEAFEKKRPLNFKCFILNGFSYSKTFIISTIFFHAILAS